MKPWTPADKAVLAAHYPARGSAWCAVRLKRSKAAVRVRAYYMGLKRRPVNTPRHHRDSLDIDSPFI